MNKGYLILDKAGYKKDDMWEDYMTWFSNYPICSTIESAYKKITEALNNPYFQGAFEEYMHVSEEAFPKLEKIKEWFSGFDAGLPYEWTYEYKNHNYTGMIGFEIWRVEVEE